MNDILWMLTPLVGTVGEDEGEGLALRKEGDEILFAPFKKKPLKWVEITTFSMLDDEGDGEHSATPVDAGVGREKPFPDRVPRRR